MSADQFLNLKLANAAASNIDSKKPESLRSV